MCFAAFCYYNALQCNTTLSNIRTVLLILYCTTQKFNRKNFDEFSTMYNLSKIPQQILHYTENSKQFVKILPVKIYSYSIHQNFPH